MQLKAGLLLLAACGRVDFAPITDTNDGGGMNDGRSDGTSTGSFTLFSGCTDLVFVGDAICTGETLDLTKTDGSRTAGAIWFAQPVTIAAGLHVQLEVAITVVTKRADGMAFVIHDDPRGTAAIGEGSYLGLGPTAMIPSIAVELDTYDDIDPVDIDNNHLGYDRDAAVLSFATITAPLDLASGTSVYVWIDYAGTTLDTYLASTAIKPPSPALTSVVADSFLTGPVWLGFVGGSEATYIERHQVLAWSMTFD